MIKWLCMLMFVSVCASTAGCDRPKQALPEPSNEGYGTNPDSYQSYPPADKKGYGTIAEDWGEDLKQTEEEPRPPMLKPKKKPPH